MKVKFFCVIIKIFLVLMFFNLFIIEAQAAEAKKKGRIYDYKTQAPSQSQPKQKGGTILQAGDPFYWDNAVLLPGDTVYCNSDHIVYDISLYEVSVGDVFKWLYYNPVKDSRTGFPTGAYELNAWMTWSYQGDYWQWLDDRMFSYKYYYPYNYGTFGGGVYIAGDEPEMYAGTWRVEIWRRHEGVESLLTSTTFNLIDICPPHVRFNAPANNATVEGRVTVNVYADDYVFLGKLEIWADNTTTNQSYLLKEFTSKTPDNIYEFTWATRQYPLGKYTLRARATDIYNNTAEAQINVMSVPVVGVVRIDVDRNVRPPGVEGPITVFTGQFDSEGNIIPHIVQPIVEYLNDDFDLIIYLDAYPQRPDWLPYAEFKWQLWGGPNSGSFTVYSDWKGIITISTKGRPTDRLLGEDQLKLELKFFAPVGAAAKTQSNIKEITPQAAGGLEGDMVGDLRTLLPLFIPPKIKIISPAMDADFDLDQNNYTSTAPINFQAIIEPAIQDAIINWEVKLNYRTSGGRCADCDDLRTFTTIMDGVNEVHQETFSSMGGSMEINACVTFLGRTSCTDPKGKATITGVAIPDDAITARLVSLYNGGATPRLMTGLAMEESSYRQFADITLFNRLDKWPLESYDGGSHIGLMMPPTTMSRAWDWLDNTQFCVNLFLIDKMGIARTAVSRMRALYPGLRDLTGLEYENMALVLYGPYADAGDAVSGPVQRQYYVVNSTGTDWVVNTAGNDPGVKYADRVRSKIR